MSNEETTPKGKILVIDDDSSICRILARCLGRQGHHVETATRSSEGLQLAMQERFPVMMVDLNLGDGNGLELVRKLARHRPDTRFILMTGGHEEDVRRASSAQESICGVLSKPWSAEQLQTLLDRAFAPSEAPVQAEKESPYILVAERQRGSLALGELLGQGEIEVGCVNSFTEAMDVLEERRPVAMVCDVALQGSQDPELVARIRAIAPYVPLVAIGLDDDAQALACLRVGADEYLGRTEVGQRTLTRAIQMACARKMREAKLLQMAHTDPLTGLANRLCFQDRMRQAIVRAQRQRSNVGVLFVDLDDFKAVNDGLGHDVGDGLLSHVGACLRAAVRRPDTVARLGGDEFAILLDGVEAEQASQIARRVLKNLSRPVLIQGRCIQAGGSIGVAVSGGLGETPESLLKAADEAMYSAKRSGRGLFRCSVRRGAQEAAARSSMARRRTAKLDPKAA